MARVKPKAVGQESNCRRRKAAVPASGLIAPRCGHPLLQLQAVVGQSNLGRFRESQCIFLVDAEVSNGGLDLGMPPQVLHDS